MSHIVYHSRVAAGGMSGPQEYAMSGVKVKFPHKAYPSQVHSGHFSTLLVSRSR